MTPPSVLLFDLGGVLVHTKGFESIKNLLARVGRDDYPDDQSLRDRWLASPSVRGFELGRTTASEFAARFVEEWQVPIEPEAFLEDVVGWIDRVSPGAEELLSSLREDYVVCCLSNCNEIHWAMIAPFLTNFDFAFSSHLLGQIKPDKGAFRAVMKAVNVEPAGMCFFDDSRTNVAAAERIGIRSFLVDGPEEIREVLKKEGLL